MNYFCGQPKELIVLSELADKLAKSKLCIPYAYIEKLKNNGSLQSFCNNSDFRFFKGDLPNINELLLQVSEEERVDFYKFATLLGCFDNRKLLNSKGKETNIVLAQKATSTISLLMKTYELEIGKYHELFKNMPALIEPDSNFLKFISDRTNEDRRFQNLELLIDLEDEYPGIFSRVMLNFEAAKKSRKDLNEKGKPTILPWEDALKKFYIKTKYEGVTSKNVDLATLFSGKGLSQEFFDKATELRGSAQAAGVPDHILGKHLKERPSILESMEHIKDKTAEEIENGRQMIESMYEQEFSYDWISKNDKDNFILWFYTNCCGTLISEDYSGDIARSGITVENIQSIAVRDSEDQIVSKGTVYINRERGYGVINSFELEEQYREDDEKKTLMFQAYERGMEAFIKEYDSQNPDNPLKQINVGIRYNRLQEFVEELTQAEHNLTIPEGYGFSDAMSREQYIFYIRKGQKELRRRGGRPMRMSLKQIKLTTLTGELTLKAQEYKKLCHKLEWLKENNVDENDERLLVLKELFEINNKQIKGINKQIEELNGTKT